MWSTAHLMQHFAMRLYAESQCSFPLKPSIPAEPQARYYLHSVKELLTEEEQNPILGLNIVEYAGNNRLKSTIRTKSCQQLDGKIAQGKDHIIGYQLCS